MNLSDIIEISDKLAPPYLAVEGDHIGLQTGDPDWPISKVMVCLDITSHTLLEAIKEGAEAILSHHALIYNPVRSLAETTGYGRLLAEIIRSRVAVYVLHTNWDIAENGLNDALASSIGIENTVPLEITHRVKLFKVAVFVPEESLEPVRVAMGNNGAGAIGNYTHCSFRTKGTGAFWPLPGSKPFIGEVGRLEEVDEVRLEAIVPEGTLQRVLAAMLDAHPYEEVAYDVYPLENTGPSYGLGRVGSLAAPITFAKFQSSVSQALGLEAFQKVGEDSRMIKKVAVCGGSGGDYVEVAASSGADVYITGDIKHHQFLLAEACGIALIDATHKATESLGMKYFAERLSREAGGGVEVFFTSR